MMLADQFEGVCASFTSVLPHTVVGYFKQQTFYEGGARCCVEKRAEEDVPVGDSKPVRPKYRSLAPYMWTPASWPSETPTCGSSASLLRQLRPM